jgi:ABC-type transporter Mla maintaining outer membrane lipid asymmetry ATPase subunit MlaF
MTENVDASKPNDKPNKRPADSMDEADSCTNTSKVSKTINVDDNINLSQLKVKDLNELMWCNFQKMQEFTLCTIMTNIRSVINESLTQEVSRIESALEEKLNNVKINVAELNGFKNSAELKQLEMDKR